MAQEQGIAGGDRTCCIAWCGAEESSSDCQCHVSTDGQQAEQGHTSDLGIKIVKFLVEMELFPPNQSGGKEMFGSQLRNGILLG